MTRYLGINDVDTLPGTVVCTTIATTTTVDQVNSNRSTHALKIGVAIGARIEANEWTREKQKVFDTGRQFWDWINYVRHGTKPVWIFAYDLPRVLTLTGLWKLMESGEFALHRRPVADLGKIRSERLRRVLAKTTAGMLVDNSPPTALIAFHRDRWRIHCIDTLNYWDASPEQLAELCGLHVRVTPELDAPRANWIEYLHQRCIALAEAVKRFTTWHRKQELGKFGWTMAGTALAAFRHRFMMDNVELPEYQDDRDMERSAYFNGRLEALWAGSVKGNVFTPRPGVVKPTTLFDESPRGPFHLVDARSFYGCIASSELLPIRCRTSGEGMTADLDYASEHTVEYLAEVELKSNYDEFPVRIDSRTVYAVGKYWTTLCGPELLRAVRKRLITRVGRWRRYDLCNLFYEYAASIWQERVSAECRCDALIAKTCKTLLAVLHGKFLQKTKQWVDVPDKIAPQAWGRWSEYQASTDTLQNFRAIAWDVQREDKPGDAVHCFPALAAYVTAWGREYMRHWMGIAGARNVLYVNTDSLIVTDAGARNLTDAGIIYPEGIGSLRIVESSDDVEIRGPNNYRIGKKLCISGLQIGSVELDADRYCVDECEGLKAVLSRCGPDMTTSKRRVVVFDYPPVSGTIGAGGWIDRVMIAAERDD